MPCCGFELLGSTASKHDVALPCPSAGALKVLRENCAAVSAQGCSSRQLPAGWLARGLASDGCRVRDVSHTTRWTRRGTNGASGVRRETCMGLSAEIQARSSPPQPCFMSDWFCYWCFLCCSACLEVLLFWLGSGSGCSSQTQSKCGVNKLGVFAKVCVGFSQWEENNILMRRGWWWGEIADVGLPVSAIHTWRDG